MSGLASPTWSNACARALPPSLRLASAPPNSTSMSSPTPGSLRSGVTVLVTSGTVT